MTSIATSDNTPVGDNSNEVTPQPIDNREWWPAKVCSEDYFRRVIAAAFTGYHASRGSLPSIDLIIKYMGGSPMPSKVSKILGTPQFRVAMSDRGINWSGKVVGITPEQSFAISIITDPSSRKSFDARLKSAGITYTKWNTWCRQPLFSAALKAVTEQALDDNIPLVHTALTNRALTGDPRAVEFYYKLSGRFDPEREQTTNMNAVLLSVIEVLTRRITDQKLLELIGNDLEGIMASQSSQRNLPQAITAEIVDDQDVIIPQTPRSVVFEMPNS